MPGGGQGRDGVQKLYVNPQMRDNIHKVHWRKVFHNDVSQRKVCHNDVSQRDLSAVLTSTSMPLTPDSRPILSPDDLYLLGFIPPLGLAFPLYRRGELWSPHSAIKYQHTWPPPPPARAPLNTLALGPLALSLSLARALSLPPTPPRPSVLRFNDLGHPAPCQPLPAPSTS